MDSARGGTVTVALGTRWAICPAWPALCLGSWVEPPPAGATVRRPDEMLRLERGMHHAFSARRHQQWALTGQHGIPPYVT